METYLTNNQTTITYFGILPIAFITSWISTTMLKFWFVIVICLIIYVTIKEWT